MIKIKIDQILFAAKIGLSVFRALASGKDAPKTDWKFVSVRLIEEGAGALRKAKTKSKAKSQKSD